MNKTNVLGIVPARMGSKGIKGKNVKELWGNPLIYYPITNGLNSKLITKTVCSTDCPKIASIANKLGAETPFIRPAEISDDLSNDYGFAIHAVDWFEQNEDWYCDFVVILRPTAPTRDVKDVDNALSQLMKNPDAHSIKSVIPVSQNPYKMWKKSDSDFIVPILVSSVFEQHNAARQKLPDTFWQNGYIDIVRTDILKRDKSVHGFKILPYYMESNQSVDLDTEADWDALNRINNY